MDKAPERITVERAECNCRKCQNERYESMERDAFRKQMDWSKTDESVAFVVASAILLVMLAGIAGGFYVAARP